jgi:hypothetical protein
MAVLLEKKEAIANQQDLQLFRVVKEVAHENAQRFTKRSCHGKEGP